MVMALVAYRYRKTPMARFARLHRTRRPRDRKAFLQALAVGDYPRACEQLYRLTDPPSGTIESLRRRLASRPAEAMLLERLYALSFDQVVDNGRHRNGGFDVREGRRLLRACRSRRLLQRFAPEYRFNLNLNR